MPTRIKTNCIKTNRIKINTYKKSAIRTLWIHLHFVLNRMVSTIGGQAVMEGLIMRNGRMYTLAIRNSDNQIIVEKRHWFFITQSPLLKNSFLRGFPTILESLINGMSALDRSAEFSNKKEEKKTSFFRTLLSILATISLAIVCFVILPHILSLGMYTLGMGGNLETLSFHLWDGIFKIILFVTYIYGIAFIPEIKRVFQYHGAEHKVIACYEDGGMVTAKRARKYSRLHPRCGTVYLLFVLTIAVLLHTIIVPLFVLWNTTSTKLMEHIIAIVFKTLLIIPISAIAYELLRFTTRKNNKFIAKIICTPGLFLQLLSTREPSLEQLEVAVIALKEAVDDCDKHQFQTARYTILNNQY